MRNITKPKDNIPYVLCTSPTKTKNNKQEERNRRKIHKFRILFCKNKSGICIKEILHKDDAGIQFIELMIKPIVSSERKYTKQTYNHKIVKETLVTIYEKKCAFCEKKLPVKTEQTIEHYRPKSKYWQLTYSWDNLLLCCIKCNSLKSDAFEIQNNDKKQFNYESSVINSKTIHYLTPIYNEYESPLLLHPEYDDVENGCFEWNIKGEIIGKNKRAKKTIKTFDLNRTALKDERLKFAKNLEDAAYLAMLKSLFIIKTKRLKDDYRIELRNIITTQIEVLTEKSEYWAFRNHLYKKLFKSIVSNILHDVLADKNK